MGGTPQCDMRCGVPPLRYTGVADSISSSNAPPTSPIPMGRRPANRQVRRAGERDGLELHAYSHCMAICHTESTRQTNRYGYLIRRSVRIDTPRRTRRTASRGAGRAIINTRSRKAIKPRTTAHSTSQGVFRASFHTLEAENAFGAVLPIERVIGDVDVHRANQLTCPA